MSERNFKVAIIFCMLAMILMQYQNCGSAKTAKDTGEVISQGQPDPQVGIINPVSVGGIQFAQSKALVDEEDTNLAVSGLCSAEQQGGTLSWQVTDNTDSVILEGQSLCDKGVFEVLFNGVETLACGSNLKLSAYFGAKAKTELEIIKRCD